MASFLTCLIAFQLTWDILLRVEQVIIESGLAPGDGHLLVGLGVGETSHSSRGPAKDSTEVRALRGISR